MKAIYARCSTDKQDFCQQKECIEQYLKRIGENANLHEVVEKVSGTVNHKKRKLNDLLEQCEKGSVIYISELSRLGRSMNDLFNIVSYCGDNDITIIQCKDGTTIENKSIGGKALLFALSLAAEIEVENIRQRTKMGLAARKARGEQTGGTKELWGKNSSTDRIVSINKMHDESANKRRENARVNESNVFFWAFITDWIKDKGEPRNYEIWGDIAQKLNNLNQKTATGMEYNSVRAAAMYRKLKKIMK